MIMDMYNFADIPFFAGFTPEQMELLQTIFVPYDCEEGDILFNQNDLAENIFLVVDGEVDVVFKPEDGPSLVVARVMPEGVIGWSAALGRPTYTSSAVCRTDCKLLRLRHQDLHDLSLKNPETGRQVLEHLADLISERLRNTRGHVMDLLLQGLNLRFEQSSAHS